MPKQKKQRKLQSSTSLGKKPVVNGLERGRDTASRLVKSRSKGLLKPSVQSKSAADHTRRQGASEMESHQDQLAALREKDPEFYKYLLDTDKDLLDFQAGNSEDDDELEVGKSSIHRVLKTVCYGSCRDAACGSKTK